jgi:hypothetical protein
MSSKKQQLLMVLERSGENLSVNKTNDEYVLEGIFAQFGVENNNNRIYEEKEYLPHLDYLKKKIKENRLLGELDHPEKFDISLSKVSHLVEDIRYDSKKRQILGKIRLLDTPSGQIAKNLVESGVPISISSRAAGVVGENKKVQIKRIFTYDLVADPGFENAQMHKVNESFGFDSHDDNVAIYDVTNVFPAFLESVETESEYIQKEKNTSSMNNEQFVLVEDMNKYSVIMKQEIEKINERISGIVKGNSGSEKIATLEAEIATLKEYANYLAESQNNAIKYANYLAEQLGNGIRYTEHVAEKANQGIAYTQYVAEKANHGIAYTQYVAEKADRGIQYSEMLAEGMDNSRQYMEYMAQKVDEAIGYGEYIGNKLSESIGYGEYLAEKLNQSISYTEHVSEHAENIIRYSEYLAENSASKEDFKNLTEYTEYMFENGGYGFDGRVKDTSETKKANNGLLTGAIKESVNPNKYNSLDAKIDAVLESVKKQRTEMNTNTVSTNYPFLQFLSEGKREEFLNLSETEKKRVSVALDVKPSFNEAGIVRVWESALASVEVNESWLTQMPVEYMPLWENASFELKDRITRQAKMYRLETPYQIKDFWQTRGLGKPQENNSNENLNESQRYEDAKNTNSLGYSNDYVKNIADRLKF